MLNTLMRVHALDSFSYQGVYSMYCIYVWRPSADVHVGSVNLQFRVAEA